MRLAIITIAALLAAIIVAALIGVWAWHPLARLAYAFAVIALVWVGLWKWSPK